jgi:hypothetical protein
MWIFTETGFVSAVRKHDHPDLITVRARDEESLEAVCSATGADIVKSPHGDYPYRAFVAPEAFVRWVADMASDISYDNFKSHVAHTRGYDYTNALHDVWAAMLKTEDEGARQRGETSHGS